MKPTLILALLLALQTPCLAADRLANPLYEELSRAKEVKVYVALPKDDTGANLDLETMRHKIEQALQLRKSIRFTPVESADPAQITIDTQMKGFTFSLTDPIDMLVGAAAIAMDAAKQDHFAALEAVMTVRDAKGDRFSDTVRASITDATMTEAEARERILDRAAEMFVRKAFAKKLS